MSPMLTKSDLFAAIKTRAAALGLAVRSADGEGIVADAEAIRAKWFLGGRAVAYRMSCRLDEAEHSARFREAVVERSWGMPPPTLSFGTTGISGWRRSDRRTDIAPGGGGSLDFARVRDALQQVVSGAGWQFHLEGGRMP